MTVIDPTRSACRKSRPATIGFSRAIEDRGLLAVDDFPAMTALEVADHATVLECRQTRLPNGLGTPMMTERRIAVDHSTVHRWAIKLLPVLEKALRRCKREVGKNWRMDETYVKVRGEWRYLYRAVDKEGNTVDFLLRARRNKAAAQRFFLEIRSIRTVLRRR